MTAVDDRPSARFEDNDKHPVGHGRMLRKEDPRFIRGRGNYVDDVQLPGMLHLAILRSPYAHARIVSVDLSAARESPGVFAAYSGADFAAEQAHLMADLAGHQRVVAGEDLGGDADLFEQRDRLGGGILRRIKKRDVS